MSKDGAEWTSDVVCVFDGIENVKDRCANWFSERLSEEKAGQMLRDDERERREEAIRKTVDQAEVDDVPLQPVIEPTAMPDGVVLVEADAITDRKSVFIGRACRITNPSQVSS